MTQEYCKNLISVLMEWYSTNWRDLPWRRDCSPYRVWISEIMLQQTRIEAALPYFKRFVQTLPDIAALAAAPEDTLLKLWEGLGYYSRARNLQKAARMVVEQFGGQLPADYDALLSLPGIGAYTAGAISSIAFNIPAPAVDGNVMRVLARLTGDNTDVLSAAGKKHFTDLAWELIPEDSPGRFNQALMELGETVCLPNTQPHCEKCPCAPFCVANKTDTQLQLPVRSKKKPRRVEHRHVAVVITNEPEPRVLLHKRGSRGLLAGLWELPNSLQNENCLSPALLADCAAQEDLPGAKHIFSHIEWHMTATRFTLYNTQAVPDDCALVTLSQLQAQYALPSAFRTYSTLLPSLLKEDIP